MKKHIPGVIFFGLIISLFAAALAVARLYRLPEIWVVEHPMIETDEVRIRESRSDRERIRIIQAITDPLEKTVLFDLSIDEFDISQAEGPFGLGVVFSFYVVEGNGARHVSSEKVFITPNVKNDRTASRSVRLKRTWVDTFGSSDNLYVVAKIATSDGDLAQAVPFSRDFAAPVLIARK